MPSYMDYDSMIADALDKGDPDSARKLLIAGRTEGVLSNGDVNRLRRLIDPEPIPTA